MELVFRKLRADEIDIRVAQVFSTQKWQGVSLLLYKDARCDMDLLDETVGVMNWQRKHSRDNANCAVGIYDEDKGEWVWKEDTGAESNQASDKGLASDSFKRACTNWGIGRELYSAGTILAACNLDQNGKPPKSLKWHVSEITYNGNNIDQLIICDNFGNEVFRKNKNAEKNTPKTSEFKKVEQSTEESDKTQQSATDEVENDFKGVFEVENELNAAEKVTFKNRKGENQEVGSLSLGYLRLMANNDNEAFAEARIAAQTILKIRYDE